MKFFTNGSWRPRSPTIEQIPTPVGEKCLACSESIGVDDCGISMMHMHGISDPPSKLARILRVPEFSYQPWHLTCFRRSLGIEDFQA